MLRRNTNNAYRRRSLFDVPSIATYSQTPAIDKPDENDEPKTNEERLEKIGFPHEDIPLEYIDPVFNWTIMDEPVQIDHRWIMDYHSLKKFWSAMNKHGINPITQYECKSIEFLSPLKEKITTFVRNKESDHENAHKVFLAKLAARQLELQTKEQERKHRIEENKALREELTNQIHLIYEKLGEKIPDVNDEEDIRVLLARIDKLDKKLKKLQLGEAYYENKHHIQKRIENLMNKQNKTPGDEKKLDELINKLLEKNHFNGLIIRRRSFNFFPPPALIQERIGPGQNVFLPSATKNDDM